MLHQSDRSGLLEGLIHERILLLDGAMGTMIQRLKLDEKAVPRGTVCRSPQGSEQLF